MVKLLSGNIYSYERLRFTGLNTQDIFNIASQNGIIIKNAERIDYAVLEADVYRAHVKRLKKLLGDGRYKIVTVKRSGLFYKLSANAFRLVLWAGIVCALVASFILSSRTWFIRVIGSDRVDEIKGIVAQYGLIGDKASARENIPDAERAIIEGADGILWSHVQINGVFVDVYVREDKNPSADTSGEGDIYASKDALIRNLIVTGGTAQVKNGQVVSKGDKLISGEMAIGESVLNVKAEGKAIASVWYYATDEVPLVREETVLTGRECTYLDVSFLGMNFTVGGKNDFDGFVADEEIKDTHFLPIGIKRITLKETEVRSVTYDKDEVIKETEAALKARLTATKPQDAEIYSIDTAVEEVDGRLIVCVTMETVENVAIRG